MTSNAPIPKFSLTDRIKLLIIRIFSWTIPTYTTSKELMILYFLAKKLKNNSIGVEIGSYVGASSLMIAKGLKNNSKLYCIDTWKNDAMTEGSWDSYIEFQKNIKVVKEKVISIRSTSVEASLNFNFDIDYIFIDGDHSYEGVKADVDSWFPKLKSGGIIIMHDIGWADGVIKVVTEDIQPNVEKFEMLPNMFWGWKR